MENERGDISDLVFLRLFQTFLKYYFYANVPPNEELLEAQHGFRKNRCLVPQLVIYLDTYFALLDSNEQSEIGALNVDFRKVFDKIDHQKLISKLQDVGIVGKLLKLNASCLIKREQMVKFRGMKSKPSKVKWGGVPQVSILALLILPCTSTCPLISPKLSPVVVC